MIKLFEKSCKLFNLASMLVNDRADVCDGVFENTVRRRVSDHHTGKLGRVHLNLKKTIKTFVKNLKRHFFRFVQLTKTMEE